MPASKICLTCHESVDKKSGIVCDSCNRTYHIDCVEWTPQEHKNYKNLRGKIKWFCTLCNKSTYDEEKSLENIINMMDSSDILITHEFRKAFCPNIEPKRSSVEKEKSKSPKGSEAISFSSQKAVNSGESLVLHIANKNKAKKSDDSSESLVLHIANNNKGRQYVDSCEFIKRKPSLIHVSKKSSPKCLTKMEKVQEEVEEEEGKKVVSEKRRSFDGFEQTKNNESLKTLFAQKQSLVKSFEHLDHKRQERKQVKKVSSEALLVNDLVHSISCMLKEEMKDPSVSVFPAEFYVNPNNSAGSLESESDDRLEYIKDDVIEWNKNKDLKPIIKRRDSKEVKFVDEKKSKVDIQVRSRGTNSTKSVLSHEKFLDKKNIKLSGAKISKSPKAQASAENGFITNIVGRLSRIFPTKVKNQDKETEIDDEIKPFVADTSVQTNKKRFSNTGVNPTKTIRIDEECQHPEEATLDEEKDESVDEDESEAEVSTKEVSKKSKISSKKGEFSVVRRPRSRSKSPKSTAKGSKSRKASQKGASPLKSKSFRIYPKRTETKKTDG